VWAFKGRVGYLDHPLWIGFPAPVIRVFVAFQVIAAIGFMVAAGSWIVSPPTGSGIGNYFAVLLVAFLGASILWPVFAKAESRVGAVLSLVVAAIASILMVAGAAEESQPRAHVVGGFLVFALVTVLADGVAWNARYIKG
jgi:hypothetical protein